MKAGFSNWSSMLQCMNELKVQRIVDMSSFTSLKKSNIDLPYAVT